MKLCRFRRADSDARVGLLEDNAVLDLSGSGVGSLELILEDADPVARLQALQPRATRIALGEVRLLPPVEQQEVWAAGVTYLRSKTARMEESDFSATAYDRVYDAPRPELFFKSMPQKVVGPVDAVGIRRDARWNVPEPELALVISSRGRIVGCTIGNDMSSRDIEGENLLYLPQAKIYSKSCALGPAIALGADEAAIRAWAISIRISRAGRDAFTAQTSVGQIKRTFADLCDHLFRSQQFPHGAILLTGTGIVPPEQFTLEAGDTVHIAISGIGVLENVVERV
jgi:2-dehydro-3-deoxy-D-arabinonate dehydratase